MKSIAIIYDLDDTIFPTRSIPASIFQPVFDAIKNANHNFLSVHQLQEALEELWVKPMDVVAKDYAFNETMIAAGRNALRHTKYQLSLSPFEDYAFIKEINCKRFLVTTGVTNLQQSKIKSLIPEGDFDEIIIDDPYQDDRSGKKNIFADIALRHKIKPENIWIVGDNPDSEIQAGNALGMKTVQILRPGIKETDQSDHVITSFSELKGLIALIH